MPATIGKSDNTILHALAYQRSEFVDLMGLYLQIAHISSRYSTLLGQYEHDSTGLLPDPLPIVQTLDTELGIFQARNALTWSPTVEITFLGARLYPSMLWPTSLSILRQPPGEERQVLSMCH